MCWFYWRWQISKIYDNLTKRTEKNHHHHARKKGFQQYYHLECAKQKSKPEEPKRKASAVESDYTFNTGGDYVFTAAADAIKIAAAENLKRREMRQQTGRDSP